MKPTLAVLMLMLCGCSRDSYYEYWVFYSYESHGTHVNAICSFSGIGTPEQLRNHLYYEAGKTDHKPTEQIYINQIVRIR